MKHAFSVAIAALCLMTLSIPAHAKPVKTGKVQQAQKERLVLMPLRLSEEDLQLQGAMEMALVKGLQQKYEVFFGEQVAKKAREIFLKESRNTSHKECDETRCLQGIAEAFQAELLATANITKQNGGYFIALSVQNLFDNKVVQSESIACKGCDAFAVVDKLKELVGTPVPVLAVPAEEASQAKVNLSDPETALWEEAKKGNTLDDYNAYLKQYRKGKYLALARVQIKKLKEQAGAELPQSNSTYDEQVVRDKVNKIPASLAILQVAIAEFAHENGLSINLRSKNNWRALGLDEPKLPPEVSRIIVDKNGVISVEVAPNVLGKVSCGWIFVSPIVRADRMRWKVETTCPEPMPHIIRNWFEASSN